MRGVPGYLNYRVVNRLTGAEVVPELHHPHKSRWNVRAMQLGAPATTAVGDFTLPLFAPRSREFKRYLQEYSSLDYGLRIEGYTGPVGAGSPRFSGIITSFDKGYSSYEISGKSDLWQLAATITPPGFQFIGSIASSALFEDYDTMHRMLWGDDFTNFSLSNYTVSGTWSTGTFSAFGTPALASVTPGNGVTTAYLMKTSFQPNVTYLLSPPYWSEVTAQASSLNSTSQFGFRVSDGANVSLLVLQQNATSPTYYDAKYYYNGTLVTSKAQALQAPASGVFQMTLNCDLGTVNTDWSAFTVNGTVCLTQTPAHNGITQVGLYFSQSTAGGQVQFANFAVLDAFGGVFTVGQNSTGSNYFSAAGQFLSGLSHLDLMQQAMELEGWYYRLTPKQLTGPPFGPGATLHNNYWGTLDMGPSIGSDLSSSVIFRGGKNLVGAVIEPNAEFFATAVRVGGTPSSTSGGQATIRNIGKTSAYGVIEDNVPAIAAADFNTLYRNGQAVAANKLALNLAKSVTVLRDPETVDKFRELDYITVDEPLLGLNNYKARVLAYTYEEGSVTQDLTLDQYSSEDVLVNLLRMQANHKYVANQFTNRY